MLKSILTVIKPIVLKKKPMPIGLFVAPNLISYFSIEIQIHLLIISESELS